MTERDVFDAFLIGWASLAAVIVIPALLKTSAPYGRHGRAGWGPTISSRWGWIVMESPTLLLFTPLMLAGDAAPSATGWAFWALWHAHYVNRTLIYPLRLKAPKAPMPVVICVMAFGFQLANTYLQARWLYHFSGGYADAWLTSPVFVCGAALFVAGAGANLHADNVLRNLRAPGETGYQIPRGGLYRWVSSPNYLGEIVEWVGWAIATWSLAGASFALWTIANLAPRAVANHRWYHDKFPDYPPKRRALLPFLW